MAALPLAAASANNCDSHPVRKRELKHQQPNRLTLRAVTNSHAQPAEQSKRYPPEEPKHLDRYF